MIYLKLFFTFFKIGAFTFGGGYAMLPLIQEVVLKNGWLNETELINFIAVSESTPGPFAVNVSTYVGMTVCGIGGALCATLGVILPSFVIILIVASIYEKFKNSKVVAGLMKGLKPSVVGLIGAALVSVAGTVLFTRINDTNLSEIIMSPSFIVSFLLVAVGTLMAFKKIHPIIIITVSAVVGIVAGYTLGLPIAG